MASAPSDYIARFHGIWSPSEPDPTTRPMVVLTCATLERYVTIGIHPAVMPVLIAAAEGRMAHLPWRRGLHPAPFGAWDGCRPIWPTRRAWLHAWWIQRRQGWLQELRLEGFTPTSGWAVRACFQVGMHTVCLPIAASAGVFLTLTARATLRVTAEVLAAEGHPIGDDLRDWQR